MFTLWLASAQPIVPVAPNLVSGPMFVEVEEDPITDAVSAFAVAQAGHARLSIGCDPDAFDGLQVRLQGRAWFAGENRFTPRIWVKHRFDKMRPRRTRWSTDDGAAYLRSRRGVLSFLGWMRTAEQVTLRTKDVEGRQLDLIFPLVGKDAAIEQMLGICGSTRS